MLPALFLLPGLFAVFYFGCDLFKRAVCVYAALSGYCAAVITLPAFSCHNTRCLGSRRTAWGVSRRAKTAPRASQPVFNCRVRHQGPLVPQHDYINIYRERERLSTWTQRMRLNAVLLSFRAADTEADEDRSGGRPVLLPAARTIERAPPRCS